MQVLESTVSPQSDDFRANAEAMEAHITTFREVEQKVLDLAEAARDKFTKRGKLLPRDRINRLLDRGTPFLELCSLAGYKMHDDKDGSLAGGGIIAGIGYVSGIRCLVVASNSAIKGGTITPAGLDKTLRLQQIAMENKLPVVSLSESGGANLNYATDIFVLGARGFANQARMSAAGIPQVTVVHGNATAGGAYQPGLSDYVIAVRDQAKMFLAGPPLLKAATGEVATDEELGGAEMHATVAGTAEYLAEDDADGIRQARNILEALPWSEQLPPRRQLQWEEPRYPAEELLGVIPADSKKTLRRARNPGPHCRRFKVHGLQERVRRPDRLRHHSHRGPLGRHHWQQRPDHPRRLRQGGPVHPAVRPGRHAASVPAQHHRLHGRHALGAERHHQTRLEDDPGGGQLQGPQGRHGDRRFLWCR